MRVVLAACAGLLLSVGASAQPREAVAIGFVTQHLKAPAPPSPLDLVPEDAGLQGARLGIADNSTTGRFTGQEFRLEEAEIEDPSGARAAVQSLVGRGARLIVADVPAPAVEALAKAAEEAGAVVLNTRAPDDALRNEACRRSLFHVVPSRAMEADALAQYLITMRWPRWLLVVGGGPEDRHYADAVRAAAKRFGGKIVAEKTWTFEPGNPHADSGHVTLQTEIPSFTRAPNHDVLIVADEGNVFGEYLPYRTALPRPVAGTQGLIATAWSPAFEQWGATQLQSRFERQAKRPMTLRDYTAWLAVRAIGEAAIRTRSADVQTIAAYMESPKFALAGFKGQPLSFRPRDRQLRQPVLVAGPRLVVSVSPQSGFLHEGSPLDSLGPDQGESRCRS
ncbi:MAG: ABC transporter substrate-binding protein [Gemmatimonas sp.]